MTKSFLLFLLLTVSSIPYLSASCSNCLEDCRQTNKLRRQINSLPQINSGSKIIDCEKYCSPACSAEKPDKQPIKLKPESHGITIDLGTEGRYIKRRFKTLEEATAYIDTLPPQVVSLIIFYGHGAPGYMTIGKSYITAETIVNLVKDKMENNSAIHLMGCNTASISMNEISINPLKGLSYLTRRILYYNVSRLSGASRKTANEMWNEDLALNISTKLQNVKVCGLTTFGLVPERFVGREKIEPGYVLGAHRCYKNGREIK